MRPTLKLFRRFPLLRGMLVGAAVFSVALAVLMAASPSLHHLLHNDADEADHQCVATFLSRDHVLSLDSAPVLVAPAPGRIIEVRGEVEVGFHSQDFLISPGRAPPVLS